MVATAKTTTLHVIMTEETVVMSHGLEMVIAILEIISDLVEILMVVIVKIKHKHFKKFLCEIYKIFHVLKFQTIIVPRLRV